MKNLPPVITIDGPSGVGKGTVARLLAQRLSWHFLDSGILYRALAWAVLHHHEDPTDEAALTHILQHCKTEIRSDPASGITRVFCDEEDITESIRSEGCSAMSSTLSAFSVVREALLERQREMRQLPGLVTDGRDMGTVVFPNADLKFFFTAEAEERAKRRFNQLKGKGINVSLQDVLKELKIRDFRDQNREIAPLKPASDGIIIDTTHLSVNEVLEQVLLIVKRTFGVLQKM